MHSLPRFEKHCLLTPFALTGLAECLRSEFQLYDISIHAYFPGTILSPGYQEENKTKPAVTKKLEGPESDGLTPEQCARGLLKGECQLFSRISGLPLMYPSFAILQASRLTASSSRLTLSVSCFVQHQQQAGVYQATTGC